MMRSLVLLVPAVLLLAYGPAAAEFLMQERDGVLYIKNVEPPRPAVAENPGTAVAYRELIRAAAARYTLAPELVEAVIRVESNFEPRAVSPKGARGLMQLMPATAALLGVRNVFNVAENIDGGVRHLRDLVDRYQGNLALALAAYNAGADAVARHGGIPPYAETQAYVRRILRRLEHAGVPTRAQTAGGAAAMGARVLYRYEALDGQVVYSNLPIDRLSASTRDLLRGSGVR
jgi:soluble lytic murein transglycosylase-like protein